MKYYFLKEDFEELDNKIAEIREKIIFHQKEKKLSATQSSETWHDNYGFEESERQIQRMFGKLEELIKLKNSSELIKPESKNNKFNIGKTIKIKDTGTGKEKEISIGSYIAFKNKKAISYESPIAKLLYGAKKGETLKGVISGKKVEFQIINITD